MQHNKYKLNTVWRTIFFSTMCLEVRYYPKFKKDDLKIFLNCFICAPKKRRLKSPQISLFLGHYHFCTCFYDACESRGFFLSQLSIPPPFKFLCLC